MSFLIKYGVLILLFLVLINQTQTYFDFTASNSNLIIIPALLGLILICFIIIYIYESKKAISSRTTSIILILFFCFFGVNICMNYVQSNKEIMFEYYIPSDSQLKTSGYELKLYKDNTYQINEYWHGKSKHYFGEYDFDNNILTFNDKDIENKTNSLITMKYRFNTKIKEFNSLENGYPNLKPRNKDYKTD